jgi:lipopolysaccharide/colanic/teichoic acid biosynthesis glycosyltransferase
VTRSPRRPYTSSWSQRTLDLTVAFVALLATTPLLLAIAVAIRLDSPGPVMFRQPRTGLGGHRFPMFKFRTMVSNAEELKPELAHLNILPPPDFKIPDDPRVTRVGKVLRATSLDELPQLLNVLRGEMSLVGPRPTSFSSDTYSTWHSKRLEVKPGLTGLWQIGSRGLCDFDERLRIDIDYIDRRNLALDLRILFGTVVAVVRRTGV